MFPTTPSWSSEAARGQTRVSLKSLPRISVEKIRLPSTSELLTDLILQKTFKPQILHLPAAISHGENPRMMVELPSNTTRWRNLTLTVACGYLVEDLKIAKLMSET